MCNVSLMSKNDLYWASNCLLFKSRSEFCWSFLFLPLIYVCIANSRFYKIFFSFCLRSWYQKSKNLANDALSKARQDSLSRQELESQISQFSATLGDLRTDNSSLLAACALLSGALLPVYTRLRHMSAQRRILEQQIGNVDAFKRQARELAQTISMETATGPGRGGRVGSRDHHGRGRGNRCLLLKFRIAAIAVMAANR